MLSIIKSFFLENLFQDFEVFVNMYLDSFVKQNDKTIEQEKNQK